MILGKRVESEEVENLLNTCSEVERGVVIPYTDSNNLSYLAAYIVPRDEGKFDYAELRRKLSMYLTPFMVPEFFIKMQALPMTANGKVKYQHTNKRHRLTQKDTKRKRIARGAGVADVTNTPTIKKLVPYM